MKEQTLKYLTILLSEFERGQSYLESDLSNDELNESERLDINSDLIEVASKIEEIKKCISWVKKSNFFFNLSKQKLNRDF